MYITLYADDTWFDDHIYNTGWLSTNPDGSFCVQFPLRYSALDEDWGQDEVYAKVRAWNAPRRRERDTDERTPSAGTPRPKPGGRPDRGHNGGGIPATGMPLPGVPSSDGTTRYLDPQRRVVGRKSQRTVNLQDSHCCSATAAGNVASDRDGDG